MDFCDSKCCFSPEVCSNPKQYSINHSNYHQVCEAHFSSLKDMDFISCGHCNSFLILSILCKFCGAFSQSVPSLQACLGCSYKFCVVCQNLKETCYFEECKKIICSECYSKYPCCQQICLYCLKHFEHVEVFSGFQSCSACFKKNQFKVVEESQLGVEEKKLEVVEENKLGVKEKLEVVEENQLGVEKNKSEIVEEKNFQIEGEKDSYLVEKKHFQIVEEENRLGVEEKKFEIVEEKNFQIEGENNSYFIEKKYFQLEEKEKLPEFIGKNLNNLQNNEKIDQNNKDSQKFFKIDTKISNSEEIEEIKVEVDDANIEKLEMVNGLESRNTEHQNKKQYHSKRAKNWTYPCWKENQNYNKLISSAFESLLDEYPPLRNIIDIIVDDGKLCNLEMVEYIIKTIQTKEFEDKTYEYLKKLEEKQDKTAYFNTVQSKDYNPSFEKFSNMPISRGICIFCKRKQFIVKKTIENETFMMGCFECWIAIIKYKPQDILYCSKCKKIQISFDEDQKEIEEGFKNLFCFRPCTRNWGEFTLEIQKEKK